MPGLLPEEEGGSGSCSGSGSSSAPLGAKGMATSGEKPSSLANAASLSPRSPLSSGSPRVSEEGVTAEGCGTGELGIEERPWLPAPDGSRQERGNNSSPSTSTSSSSLPADANGLPQPPPTAFAPPPDHLDHILQTPAVDLPVNGKINAPSAEEKGETPARDLAVNGKINAIHPSPGDKGGSSSESPPQQAISQETPTHQQASLAPKDNTPLSLQSQPKPVKKSGIASPRLQSPRLQSPRLQHTPAATPKPKDMDKDKIISPKSHSPKLRSMTSTVATAAPSKPSVSEKDIPGVKSSVFDKETPGAKVSVLDKEKRQTIDTPYDGKRSDVKRQSPPQTTQIKRPPPIVVRTPETPPLENKRRIHPIKDKEKSQPEKASPNSPRGAVGSPSNRSPVSPLRPLKINSPPIADKAPNVGARTPTNSKQASRFMEASKLSPKSPASQEKKKPMPEKASQTGSPAQDSNVAAEGDKEPRKMKELFLRKKSGMMLGSRKFGDSESIVSSEQMSVLARENKDLGPFLLKLAKQAVASGDNPQKALDYATRASKSYESAADGKPSLELVMSLHILAAIHCTLGQFEEAIPVLQHSIEVPDIEGGGQEHALAAFAGNMQLGDTFALLGKGEDALAAYHAGLEVQKKALGENDPRVGETCRYLAEAHALAMQFDKAEELCQHALDIHKEHSAPASVEEATDRRLMGLIFNGKGQYEAALEHLVLASMSLIANSKDLEVAAVDTSIGDTYVCLGRFDEAVFAYQKALTVFKASKGENHVSVASVYVSLAELYLKTGKLRESKTYCESAARIYNKHITSHQLDEVASGLTELASVYEALNEPEQALSLLQKALIILETAPGQQSAVAGVEAQIGVLKYLSGNFSDAQSFLNKAVSKLRVSAEKTSPLFGIVLNQLGLACLHLSEVEEAAELFEESRSVLDAALGPHHPDTLSVYGNLAGAYDALGRLDEAIGVLQYVLEVREEELGTANPEVDDEKNRLAELLKEAGRFRARRLNNTLALLMNSNTKPKLMGRPGHYTPAAGISVNS